MKPLELDLPGAGVLQLSRPSTNDPSRGESIHLSVRGSRVARSGDGWKAALLGAVFAMTVVHGGIYLWARATYVPPSHWGFYVSPNWPDSFCCALLVSPLWMLMAYLGRTRLLRRPGLEASLGDFVTFDGVSAGRLVRVHHDGGSRSVAIVAARECRWIKLRSAEDAVRLVNALAEPIISNREKLLELALPGAGELSISETLDDETYRSRRRTLHLSVRNSVTAQRRRGDRRRAPAHRRERCGRSWTSEMRGRA